ncbi:hypothetical protein Emtol_3399 [Emticicia oligotrophica DSM 17448]|uniref:Uncharacterized protein n=1 Tax=Emticicia oligotrophica (strain DSM 17448 / CIP 109782 / MTCC 6937 / GPTSA100-15) TaxID=929562 RepID=A0ABN4AQ57_EMTOG|nr:hypothetical protein Emtol_3399 [Emticicia oligotrophica DSM 17448]
MPKNLIDPNYRAEFGDSLDIEILKKEIENFENIEKMLPIERPIKLRNFKVNHCYTINDNTYILTTLVEFENLVTPRPVINAMDVCDLNFKILIDYKNSKLIIYSDIYTELFDKQLRKEFADLIYEFLINGNELEGHFSPKFKQIKNEYSNLTDDELNYLVRIRTELSVEEQDILFIELEKRHNNR